MADERQLNRDFGSYLTKLIHDLGISHAEFARRIKVDPQRISDYVSGRREPPPATYGAMRRELQLTEGTTKTRTLDALYRKERRDPPAPQEPAPWQPKDEQEFVKILDEAARSPLHFGGKNLKTKLLPEFLWDVDKRESYVYHDHIEERRIYIEWTNSTDNLWDTMKKQCLDRLSELNSIATPSDTDKEEVQTIDDVLQRLRDQGSNPYPRPVAVPHLVQTNRGVAMRLFVGEGSFATQAVREKNINIPLLREAQQQFVFSSLALRILYASSAGERDHWAEFQQRSEENSTWKLAWDVGASGYVDRQKHRYSPRNRRISPHKACALEIEEELNIDYDRIPNPDHFHFFGYAQDLPTRHVILLGLCESGHTPDPGREPPRDENGIGFVEQYDHCILQPQAIAEFIAMRKRWVPSAILTLILALEFFGYEKEEIEEAFIAARVKDYLNLSPW